MSARHARAEAPAIEYGEIERKNSLWFACRARIEQFSVSSFPFSAENREPKTENHPRYVPDDKGSTLMYFASEQQLLGHLKVFGRKAVRVEARELTAARTRWLSDRERQEENEF